MADDAKIPPADPKETAVALKGLAPSVDEAALTTTVGAHGKLLRVKLDGLGGAHVVFASTRAAQRAAAALNGAVVQGQRISAQHVRTFSKTTRPCRGFLEGKCRKGDQCKYWHGTDSAAATAVAPPTVASAKTKKAKATPAAVVTSESAQEGDDISGIPKASICRNFAKGACVHADKCRFAHVLGAGALPPPPRASIPAPCSFFLAGRCTKGDDCAFLHTDRPPQPPASKPTMCSYFAAGRCARGDQCAYLHETKPGATPAAVAAPVTKAKQPTVTPKPTVAKAVTAKKAAKAAVAGAAVAPVNGDRACIECEKPGVATWICAGCDNAKYCDECKTLVHTPKVMRSHTQVALPALPTRPFCGECEKEIASIECKDCGVPYCASCDASVHQFKSLRGHTRTPLDDAPAPKKTAEKKKTVKAEAVVAPKAVVTAYIDSVPQYDLPSESDSSEDEEEEQQRPQQQQRHVQQAPVDDSSSESDDEDEQESPAAAAMRAATTAATGYVESVPKYELSSESESSDDEDDEEETTADDDDSVEEVKQSIVKAAVVAVKQKILSPVKTTTRVETLSSESSDDSDDDDFEDERPIVTTGTAKSTTKLSPPTTAISSESDSDSDDEDAKPTANSRTAPTSTPKRKASVSSKSSSDSSDDENVRPAAKQQRVVAKPTPASTPAARAPRATAAPTKVGISTGSSHSLVKTIEAYAESDNTEVLHLDPNLNGFERLLAHDCAERLGLNHVSVGEGLERHITVSRKGDAVAKRSAASAEAATSGKKQKRA